MAEEQRTEKLTTTTTTTNTTKKTTPKIIEKRKRRPPQEVTLKDTKDLTAKENNERDKICSAVLEGNVAEVKKLLESGVDPNEYYNNTVSHLHVAVLKNDLKMVELLLEKGANTEKPARYYDYYRYYYYDDLLNLLDDYDYLRPGDIPLHIACRLDYSDIIFLLSSSDPFLLNLDNESPLDLLSNPHLFFSFPSASLPHPFPLEWLSDQTSALQFICPICQALSLDPVYHFDANEGSVFCKICINRLLSDHQTCPICRCKVTPSNMSPLPKIAMSFYNNLQVQCPFCQQRFSMGKFSSHFMQCQKQVVPCDNLGCDGSFPREELKAHMKEHCKMRLVSCPNFCCKFPLKAIELDSHLDRDCPLQRFQCPNSGCTNTFKREELPHHVSQCPEAIVTCGVGGCQKQVKRKFLDRHLEEKVAKHLLLFSSQQEELMNLLKNILNRLPNK